MKHTKRLLALLLTLCMVLSLVPAAHAEEVTPLAKEDEVVIYYTNDVHTYIDKTLSYDNIADLKAKTAEQAADVLLVDAGDHIQGTAYGSMDKGATIIELMNAAGYDLATLGNHEFDYTMEGAMNVIEWAEYPYVSANFYHEKDGVKGETVLEAYEVFELGEHTVAIIGITTPESFTKSTPAYFQDDAGNYIYGISGGEDGTELYADVQKAIDAASEEAEIVIALAHLGDDAASKPWTSEEVIANTTGLDAVIDGHSHSTVPMKEVADKGGSTVILTQTGEYFGAIGRMSIAADGAITTSLITEYTGSDAAVKEIKDTWIAEIDTQLGEVIGHAEVTFDNYDADGNRLVRKQETNTGDFAADALYYLFDNMDMDVDVAIMNGGGVRNKAITGDISYKTCKEIHTFGNVACLQTITGQQLLDALEWGARDAGTAECGGFLQVSGVKYTVDTNITSTVQKDEKGVWTGGPTGEYRVKDVKILQGGEYVDLDLDAKYNLAGYNYTLRDLGDGFAMFDGAVNVLDYVMEDYMVLANYVQSFEDGRITAENSPYGDVYGEGRITMIPVKHDEHTYAKKTVEATCMENAKDVYTCTVPYCGESYEEETPNTAMGHICKTVVVDPTCTEDGYTEYECIDCDYKERKNPTKATGHTFEDGECTACGEKAPKTFEDVEEGAYYYDSVQWAVANDVTQGVSATAFDPNGTCTRAQVVTFLWRANGSPKPTTEENPFKDVKEGAYYYDAIMWAVENKITNGVSEDTFGTGDSCTRAQVATFLWRSEESPEPTSAQSPFKDIEEKSYYYDAVLWAVGNKITNGLTETQFGPDATCTRGQVVTFLYRLLAE